MKKAYHKMKAYKGNNVATTIKMDRVFFAIYLFTSFLICSYFYYTTIGSGFLSVDNDYHGFLRAFPSDLDVYISRLDEPITEYFRNIGPSLIIWVFGSNYFLIYLIQFSALQLLVYKLYRLSGSKLFLGFLCLPILTISCILPNKEYFSTIFLGLVVIFCLTRRPFWLILSVVPAILARPELVLFLICFIVLDYYKRYFTPAFILILAFTSIFYTDLHRMDDYRHVLEQHIRGPESVALYLDNLSRDYNLFFIVFPFKVLLSLYDGGLINMLLCIPLFIASVLLNKNSSVTILIIFYVYYATLPSFIQFRYLIPVYIILFLMASSRRRLWMARTVGAERRH